MTCCQKSFHVNGVVVRHQYAASLKSCLDISGQVLFLVVFIESGKDLSSPVYEQKDQTSGNGKVRCRSFLLLRPCLGSLWGGEIDTIV